MEWLKRVLGMTPEKREARRLAKCRAVARKTLSSMKIEDTKRVEFVEELDGGMTTRVNRWVRDDEAISQACSIESVLDELERVGAFTFCGERLDRLGPNAAYRNTGEEYVKARFTYKSEPDASGYSTYYHQLYVRRVSATGYVTGHGAKWAE